MSNHNQQSDPGKKQKVIVRYTYIDRICHWTVVICFFLVALSGISMFFPSLQWLTETFGTPQMGRILHPFFGLIVFSVLMIMFFRFVKHNKFEKGDGGWFIHIIDVLKGNEHEVADVGKYNPGQKMMFWCIMGFILTLAISGIIIWRPYFSSYFPIYIVRVALVVHAVTAILLMYLILMHMYMAFWVRGSIKSMIGGKVSRMWAKKHHPRWLRELDAESEKAAETNEKETLTMENKNEVDQVK